MRARGIVAAVLITVAAPVAAGVTIEIGGDAAAQFSMVCTGPGTEAEPFRAEGHPPARHDLDGTPQDCTLRQSTEGALLELKVESTSGNVSYQAISGADSVVQFIIN